MHPAFLLKQATFDLYAEFDQSFRYLLKFDLQLTTNHFKCYLWKVKPNRERLTFWIETSAV